MSNAGSLLAVGCVLLASLLTPGAMSIPLGFVQEVSVEDATGDAHINGIPAEYLDITDVRITTNLTHLHAEMGVLDAQTARDSGQGGGFSQPFYWVTLEFQGEEFDLVWETDWGAAGSAQIDRTMFQLFRRDADGWSLIAEALAEVDLNNDRLRGGLPLNAIQATKGFSPGPGESLSFLRAASYFDPAQDPHDPFGQSHPLAATKGMVEGTDEVEFPEDSVIIVDGDASEGLALGTSRPIRFSNGEATTYHWPVLVSNRGASQMELVVSTKATGDFTVHAPQTILVAADSQVVVDVFATAPFAHEHGAVREVLVSVDGGGNHAKLPLVVKYLDVPQPAGHHDTVFFHTSGADGGAAFNWFDTRREPEQSTEPESPLGSVTCFDGSTQTDGRGVAFPLFPELVIGVDARIDEPAIMTGTFTNHIPHAEGEFFARFYTYDTVTENPYSTPFNPASKDSVSMVLPATTASSSTDFAFALPVPEILDRLEPGAQQNLAIQVGFCDGRPPSSDFGPHAAEREAGLRMRISDVSVVLPFDEYHDEIPIDVGRGITVDVGQAKRTAAPGAVVLWNIHTDGEATGELGINTLGLHSELLQIHGERFHVSDTIPVSITVPENQGDMLEAIVEVYLVDEPQRRAALRLVVDIDETSTNDDRRLVEDLQPQVESPGPPVLAVLVALVAVAFILRQRRQGT